MGDFWRGLLKGAVGPHDNDDRFAWWLRRTYYLFQMPRWDRRLRIVLDWTVALFFRPDITKVELHVEREQVRQTRELIDADATSRSAPGRPC